MVNRQYKCPVCGAPLEGDKCEYCGCVIYDFAVISTNEPRYIKFQVGDHMLLIKAIAINPQVEILTDTVDITGGGNTIISSFAVRNHCKIKVEFDCIENDGSLLKLQNKDRKYKASWEDDIYGA